jgi:hypothetical protein
MLQEQFIIFDVESTRLQKSDKSRCHSNNTITNKLRLNFASVSTHVSYSSHNFCPKVPGPRGIIPDTKTPVRARVSSPHLSQSHEHNVTPQSSSIDGSFLLSYFE